MKPSITVTGQKELVAKLIKKEGSITKDILASLYRVGLLILKQAKINLKNNGSIATGALRISGVVRKVVDGAEIVFKKEYASNVEFGQKAGTEVSAKQLEGWVMKKGLADSFTASGNRRGRGASFSQKVKSIAFLVARKISKYGTKPAPYFQPAIDQYRSQIIGILKREVKV